MISVVSFEDQASFGSFPAVNGQVFVGAYHNFLISRRSTVFA